MPNAIAFEDIELTLSYLEAELIISGICKTLRKELSVDTPCVTLITEKSINCVLIFFALLRYQVSVFLVCGKTPQKSLKEYMQNIGTNIIISSSKKFHNTGAKKALTFRDLLYQKDKMPRWFFSPNFVATYTLTSGSSSTPKIACHSFKNHFKSAIGSQKHIQIQPGDRYLFSMHLHHIAGLALLFRTLTQGATVSFNHTCIKITHISFLPIQLLRFMREKKKLQLKCILLGGAPISKEIYTQALGEGLNVLPSYGMTEMSSTITSNISENQFSMGHPLPYRKLKISSDGEILVKGDTLFKGYLNNTQSLSFDL